MQHGHRSGPLPKALLGGAVLLGSLEHDLHAHTDSQDRASAGQALLDKAGSINRPQLVHDRAEGTDTGNHQAIGLGDLVGVVGQGDLRSDAFQGTHRRTDIAGSVGQDGDSGRLHVTYPTVPADRSGASSTL